MSERDLDIAIEKCERIMEFDTRTLKNPESENGWLFEKVYDLLEFLRELQFATGGMDDTISRHAAINAICEDGTRLERQGQYSMTMAERKQRDVDILVALPSATDTNVGGTDTISRSAAIEAIRKAKDKSELHRMLVQLPPAQRGWIPCKTRKPEKSGLYLVTKQQKTGEIQLATAHYNTAFDEWSGNGNFKKVLAWQPLPSPWKGSHDGD